MPIQNDQLFFFIVKLNKQVQINNKTWAKNQSLPLIGCDIRNIDFVCFFNYNNEPIDTHSLKSDEKLRRYVGTEKKPYIY